MVNLSKKNWLINAALLMGSLIASVIIAEILLRIIGFSYLNFQEYDNLVGRKPWPNAEGWFQEEGKVYIKINSDGWRGHEYSKKKHKNVLRIAVLGDSFTEAYQVALENTFWSILEQKLNCSKAFGNKNVEVLNFGVSGYGTDQEFLILKNHVWNYSPDIVLLAFYTGNDIRNNSKILESYKLKPFFVFHENQLELDNSFINNPTYKWKTGLFWSNMRNFYRYSRILQMLTRLKDLNNSNVVNDSLNNHLRFEYLYHNIFFPPTNNDWQQAWSITESLLMMMRDEVEENNARFVLVTLSNDIQVHPDPEYRKWFMETYGINDLLYPDKRIKLFAKKEKIELLLLAPVFQEYAERNHIFLHGVLNSEPSGLGHWNINAHRLAGEIIAKYLCSGESRPENNFGKN